MLLTLLHSNQILARPTGRAPSRSIFRLQKNLFPATRHCTTDRQPRCTEWAGRALRTHVQRAVLTPPHPAEIFSKCPGCVLSRGIFEVQKNLFSATRHSVTDCQGRPLRLNGRVGHCERTHNGRFRPPHPTYIFSESPGCVLYRVVYSDCKKIYFWNVDRVKHSQT